jgi:hypothetical protein
MFEETASVHCISDTGLDVNGLSMPSIVRRNRRRGKSKQSQNPRATIKPELIAFSRSDVDVRAKRLVDAGAFPVMATQAAYQ